MADVADEYDIIPYAVEDQVVIGTSDLYMDARFVCLGADEGKRSKPCNSRAQGRGH